MLEDMTRLLRKLLGKFVSVRVMTAAGGLTNVDFRSEESQLGDEILAVGMEAKAYLTEADVSDGVKATFFRWVLVF